MRFLSEAERGVIDDYDGVPPDILQQYYGVEADDIESDDNGDDDSEVEAELQGWDELQEEFEGNEIAATHEPVPVPANTSPFNENSFDIFTQALQQMRDEEIIPFGLGVSQNKIGEEEYPTEEILRGGRRGRKEMRITLSVEVWLPRAIQWCQALEVMTAILVEEDL